jgi:hypothetical protein
VLAKAQSFALLGRNNPFCSNDNIHPLQRKPKIRLQTLDKLFYANSMLVCQ